MNINIWLFLIPVLIGAGSLQAQNLNHSKPNILIITTDQQFADAMSFRMGDKWIHTPNMDKLASQGVFFTRAYVANPLCVPSRNSMVTGLYPHQNDIQTNLGSLSGRDKPKWTGKKFKSIGSYFRKAGYETAYFGKWHLNYNTTDKNAHGFKYTKFTSVRGHDSELSGAVDDFLNKKPKKPFLAWASFVNPHDIAQWSRFQKLPEGPIGKVPPVSQWPPLRINLSPPTNETDAMTLIRKSFHRNRRIFPVGNYSKFDWRRLAWGYYRLVEKVDAQIGRLLRVLDTNGYGENTLVVFTSDHGESLGAHKFTQKTVFYEESVRVPLILKYGDKLKTSLNKSLVNIGIDLLPTLLDFAYIEEPKKLPGKSLKKVAQQNIKLKSRPYIVVQNKPYQGKSVNGKRPVVNGRMVRSNRYKYCLYDTLGHREALFDLKNDPGETKNIAEKKSSNLILEKHREYLEEFAHSYGDSLAIRMLTDIKRIR